MLSMYQVEMLNMGTWEMGDVECVYHVEMLNMYRVEMLNLWVFHLYDGFMCFKLCLSRTTGPLTGVFLLPSLFITFPLPFFC